MLWLLRQGLTLVQQLACSELEAAVTAVAQLGAARFLQMGLAWITPPQDTPQSLAHTIVANALPAMLMDRPGAQTLSTHNTTLTPDSPTPSTPDTPGGTWSLAEAICARAAPMVLTWAVNMVLQRRGR